MGGRKTLRTPRRRLAGLIAFTTLALLLVWPFTEAGRFLVPLVPFLLVGATEGIARARVAGGTAARPGLGHRDRPGRLDPLRGLQRRFRPRPRERRTHADFDAACRWIAEHATHPGPVLTRHPGEVFWRTGRQASRAQRVDPRAIDHLIGRLGIAYLLIDDDRYANAGLNPLGRYLRQFPDHVALVWPRNQGTAPVRVFEVLRTE